MYKDVIKILESLAKTHPEKSKEIGVSIGLMKFCEKYRITRRDKVIELPDTMEAFGYFTIYEVSEMGEPISIARDKVEHPVEVSPKALVIERATH